MDLLFQSLFYVLVVMFPTFVWWIIYGDFKGVYPMASVPNWQKPLHLIFLFPVTLIPFLFKILVDWLNSFEGWVRFVEFLKEH